MNPKLKEIMLKLLRQNGLVLSPDDRLDISLPQIMAFASISQANELRRIADAIEKWPGQASRGLTSDDLHELSRRGR